MLRRRPAARRSATAVALAAALAIGFGGGDASSAETGATPRIMIPPAKVPGIPPASRDILPSAMTTLHDPSGDGVALYGALSRPAASALGVMLAIFASSQAFDAAPSPRLVLADRDDRHAQALFTATVRGAPVLGLAVVALAPAGGETAVLYDDAEAFPDSFARLRQALAQTNAVEIGRSDNSVAEAEMAGDFDIDPGWGPAIAAMATAAHATPEGSLGASLAATLSSAGGVPWRVVPLTALK